MRETALQHAQCGPVLDLLKIHIGLDPASACADNVPSALAQLGVDDLGALAHFVEAARLDMARLDPLVNRIVVHETWFMREPAAFEVLVRDATRAVAAGRRYRVLSVPCSTGEEPYSIALALIGAGVPRAAIEIVAMDISPRAVAQARTGVFSALAFRGVSPLWRDAHFARDGTHWRLVDRFEDVVRFDLGNVMALSATTAPDSFDAVFCRNLLIYLDIPARARVFQALRSVARDGSGLIFVGHAESTDAFDSALERVAQPMSFAFHNRARPSLARPAIVAARPAPPRRPAAPASLPAAPRVVASAPAPSTTTATDPLASVRALADRGELKQAIEACERVVREQPLSADARAFRGMLAVASGENAVARESFAGALYLDPAHVTSLHHLMLLAEEDNDSAGARRYRDRLLRLQAAEPQPPRS